MRQFVSSKDFDKNGLLEFYAKDFRYLCKVLRLRVGDMIFIRVGKNLYESTVCKIDENKKIIVVQKCSLVENSENLKNIKEFEKQNLFLQDEKSIFSKTEFYLFQFTAKSAKMEQIVRQATECGVKKIIPVKSEYSQNSILKKERLEKIIKEAIQQSGSAVDTVLESERTVEDAIIFWQAECKNLLENQKSAVVLYERVENTRTLSEIFDKSEIPAKKVALVVGSEGGISPTEIKYLQSAGFLPIHFKINILRCETAALYGMAAIQSMILEKLEKC